MTSLFNTPQPAKAFILYVFETHTREQRTNEPTSEKLSRRTVKLLFSDFFFNAQFVVLIRMFQDMLGHEKKEKESQPQFEYPKQIREFREKRLLHFVFVVLQVALYCICVFV